MKRLPAKIFHSKNRKRKASELVNGVHDTKRVKKGVNSVHFPKSVHFEQLDEEKKLEIRRKKARDWQKLYRKETAILNRAKERQRAQSRRDKLRQNTELKNPQFEKEKQRSQSRREKINKNPTLKRLHLAQERKRLKCYNNKLNENAALAKAHREKSREIKANSRKRKKIELNSEQNSKRRKTNTELKNPQLEKEKQRSQSRREKINKNPALKRLHLAQERKRLKCYNNKLNENAALAKAHREKSREIKANSRKRKKIEKLNLEQDSKRRKTNTVTLNQLRMSSYADVEDMLSQIEPIRIGKLDQKCPHCGSFNFGGEALKRKNAEHKPIYSICCGHGRVKVDPLKPPPEFLKNLFLRSNPDSNLFKKNHSHFSIRIRLHFV